ncbi:MAG TPA: efflux RND transporter periplasmic adaptor subunit [Burkholderiales bacterium]
MRILRFPVRLPALVLCAALLAACGKEAAPTKRPAGPPPVLVTATQVQPRSFEVYEEVVGALENVMDPKLGAEVAGRVIRVLAHTGKKVKKGELLAEIDPQDFEIQARADTADIARLSTLLEQAERVVERQTRLMEKGFISQNAVDDATAQRNAQRDQLAAAKARGDQTRRSIGKARVLAPMDGEIERQAVASGDFVKVGDLLFTMVGTRVLRAQLLLPESAAERIQPGLKVRFFTPAAPSRVVEAAINDIKPTVGTANRALNAIVRFETSDPAFRGGGSVTARIVIAVKDKALMVPEQSVVLRPAGKVVYVIREGKAEQRVVETGLKQDALQEIVKGLAAGETVAVDGAGFLTHGAAVAFPKPAAKPGAKPEGKDGARPEGKGGMKSGDRPGGGPPATDAKDAAAKG